MSRVSAYLNFPRSGTLIDVDAIAIARSTPSPSAGAWFTRQSRRAALRRCAGLLAVAVTGASPARVQAAGIAQPPTAGPEAFMARAFELRRQAIERGDQPYGAVVVQGNRIVGEGASAVVTDRDPTAHAEMQAIRDAARRLATSNLSGCAMYGTARACPMCEAGAFWARIDRMYHGIAIADAGPPRLP